MKLPPVNRQQKLIVGCLGVGFVVAGLLLLYIFIKSGKPVADAPLEHAFEAAAATSAYTQLVETEAYFSDRRLYITGVYKVDSTKRAYEAISTTTLFVTGDPIGHVFTHENIALGEDVYTRIRTEDTLLSRAIEQLPQWQHFTATTIPKSLFGIAVAGPIQDNLQILTESGRWVTLLKKPNQERVFNEDLLHYSMSTSGAQPQEAGALDAILKRIGEKGVIDVWVDPKTMRAKYLRFMNNAYVSTTTLLYADTPPTIGAPVAKN